MKCWPWSHDWEKWREVQSGELLRRHDPETKVPYTPPMRIGQWVEQRRECRLCGRVELRTVTSV